MSYFKESVEKVNQKFYLPNQFVIENLREEPQNAEYAGGTFLLNQQLIRFRAAKITPTKIGQFVAFWEKNELDKNQAFCAEDSPDLLVVTTFQEERMASLFFQKPFLLRIIFYGQLWKKVKW